VTAPAKFTQADIKRAASGVRLAGLDIAKIEIDHSGKIVIIPAGQADKLEPSEWADLD
jgi:hypothetical protein